MRLLIPRGYSATMSVKWLIAMCRVKNSSRAHTDPVIVRRTPSDEGVVMEFGFYPQQVEMALAMYGVRAHQVDAAPRIGWTTAKRALGTAYLVVCHHLRKLLRPDAYRGASWGFP